MAKPRENSRKPAAKANKRPPIEPAPDIAEEEHAELDDPVPKLGYQTLPLVGLGGSAGSIPALQTFFSAMPADSGMAFVVVLHLSPEHESSLDELIGRWTSMPVEQVQESAKVGVNRVYVIPPGKSLTSADGHLQLSEMQADRGKRVAVDLFFRTLADSHGPRSTAIVLSGADGDGAIGIKRIKERGGLTIAQDPDEAIHSGMPRSAIDTGMVDWVLEVAEMPKRLLKYYQQESKLKLPSEDGPQPGPAPRAAGDGEAALRDVLTYLRTRTGHDFANYKRATIVRRIARRMQVNGVDEMPEYLAFLRTHAGEAGALLQDLLISVTNFFRDRDAFEALQTHIRELFRDKRQTDTIRVWVPGCATGEEAYSLAMLLVEHARTMEAPPQIQVFATDLDDDVVRIGREAVYPETIAADVSDERLRRFFVKEHRGYRVRRELRELVLFAVHDLLRDSPFSRLDLISCRNLLIYFDRRAQQRAFETFNFALQPRGIVFLGLSESADEASELFSVLDKKYRIYAHRPTARVGLPVPIGQSALTKALQAKEKMEERPVVAAAARADQYALFALTPPLSDQQPGAWSRMHFKLLERFGPPSVVIDQQHRIVHLSATAGRYLQLSGGEPSTDLLQAAHPMLRLELRGAIYRAKQSGKPASVFNVPIELDGARQAVDIDVSPAGEIAPDFMLVTFDSHPAAASAATAQPAANDEVASQLASEIEHMRATLRDTVEQHEAGTEELKASNEELQAMNEELRSATEELETSREELQSINEELTTVNQELKSNVDELGRTNADLHNLMAATDIATVFLDRELAIMRYTPAAVALFNLIPADLGRPLADLKPQLDYPELSADAERVLRSLVPVEREVRSDGRWFLARVNPYRTLDDRIAGVVLALVDITDGKRAEIAWRESEEKYRTLFESIDEGFCIIEMLFDKKGAPVDYRFVDVNPSFAKHTGLADARGRTIREFAPEHEQYWFDIYGRVALTGEAVRFENLAGVLHRWYDVYAFPVGEAHERKVAVLFTDITPRKRADALAQAAAGRDSFRIALTDALRTLTDPIAIQAVSARLVGEHLHVNRANYVEVDGDYAVVHDDYIDGVAPLAGRYRMTDYFGAGLAAQLAGGRMIVVADAESAGLSKAERTRYAAASIGARITVPLVKAGKLAALLSVQQAVPREWTADEIALVEETAERAWVAAERARVEAALATSDERLRLIFESAQDYAIISADLDGRITSWNVGAERLLGYAEAEAIGQPADIIFTPEDRAAGAPEREEEAAIKTGRASDERWHLRKDGSRFWGNGVMMAMRDRAGAVIGLVKIFRDETQAREIRHTLEQSRTELVQALQEKEKARADLESANQAKDQFLAVLSHELRTPLTPVVMAVQTLTRRSDLPEPMRAALEMIRRNVKTEARLIDDLLDLTRITRGKIEIVPEPVDLHAAITDAIEVCESDIQNKNQKLIVSLDARRYRSNGDINRLQQVVWNLLKNASKFTGAGGEIRVCTSNTGNFFSLVVEDTGMGIEAGVLPTIFDAFTQGGTWIVREYGGLGLGLAISKATIEAHGGSVMAESGGRDQGAKFTVELPLIEQE